MNSASVEDLKTLTDDEIDEMYATASDDLAKALLREASRRDRRAAQSAADKAWWDRVKAEWYDAMYAGYLAADAGCRGNLFSKEGIKNGPADAFSLWTGPKSQAMRFASEELRDWWMTHPRVTVSEYAYHAARPRPARNREA